MRKFNFLVVFVLHIYGELADALTDKEKAFLSNNATHYWNFTTITTTTNSKYDVPLKSSFDVSNKTAVKFINNVQVQNHEQLGNVIQLDGVDAWIVVPKLLDRCITRVSCPEGITISFWMKYEAGDYLLAAGRYVVDAESPGFRLQKDPESNFFVLEVSNTRSTWKIYIKDLPKEWFHFTFTWKESPLTKIEPNGGLRVYINGDLKLSKEIPEPRLMGNKQSKQKLSLHQSDIHKFTLGRIGPLKEMKSAGKFQFGHLAIWQKALQPAEIVYLFEETVALSSHIDSCCYEKALKGCKEYDSRTCICPKIKREDKCKPKPITKEKKICQNLNPHCDKLTRNGQDGYCRNFPDALLECYSSCRCDQASKFLASRQAKQHFSQEAVIFALLGCFGGLVLLFGIMFYFWKVYRTRYHGAFVPPLKSVSLLDVAEYEDEKWPNKYVDSSAFYIKDVPPKRRALPLIPAKNSQSNYRYQPPEFD